jgi:hypothetical protein
VSLIAIVRVPVVGCLGIGTLALASHRFIKRRQRKAGRYITRARAAAAAGALIAVAIAACGSSAPSGSPGDWTQPQKTQFNALGYFGSGAAFTACVRVGMESSMSYTNATKAFNAIPSGATSEAEITTAIANAVGGSDGTTVAKSFITIATRCDKQSPSSAPTPAPPAPSTTAPSPTQTPSATASAPSTPSATASPLTPWTTAQRNQLTAAYDADPALASTSLACLQAVIPEQMPADEALQYISVAWVSPAPTSSQIQQSLESKYGATQGAADFAAWPATGVASCTGG